MRKEEACPCGQAEDPRARELRSWLTEHRDEPGVAPPALQKAQEVYGFLRNGDSADGDFGLGAGEGQFAA